MPEPSIALDSPTLLVVATCVTGFLGLFLLSAWTRDRTRAMLWWGTAYLIGGASVALWIAGEALAPLVPAGLPNAFIFFACGMIWNAARLFHGRPVLWSGLCAGALVWLFACAFADFQASVTQRVVLSSLIIATYTFLTAAELWRERRRTLLARWPAIFVPVLHGAVFLFPLPLASMLPQGRNVLTLASGWMALFALETLLYVVGTAFIVLILAQERVVVMHRTAALTDPLTGLFNRRAFFEGADPLIASQVARGGCVSVLAFDLDHFKSINDRFGHALGDETLRLFAATARANMRAGDLLARLGGEEFVALLPGGIADATLVAERLRAAFAEAGRKIAGQAVGATVSIGAAGAETGMDIHALLGWADYALYSAKANGRNRVEAVVADIHAPPPAAEDAAAGRRASPEAEVAARAA